MNKLLAAALLAGGGYLVWRAAGMSSGNAPTASLPDVNGLIPWTPTPLDQLTDPADPNFDWQSFWYSMPYVGPGTPVPAPSVSAPIAAAANGLQDMAANIAAQFNIPANIFQSLIRKESSWNPTAVGASGERGLTQMMPGTWAQMGVTDPFDPVQNMTGGAKYLSQLYRQFGDWNTALAAYNAGPGNVSKGIIPASTKNYVQQILCWAGLGAC